MFGLAAPRLGGFSVHEINVVQEETVGKPSE